MASMPSRMRHREVEQDDVGLQALGRVRWRPCRRRPRPRPRSGVLLQRVAQERPEGRARRRTPVPGSAPPGVEGSGAVRRAAYVSGHAAAHHPRGGPAASASSRITPRSRRSSSARGRRAQERFGDATDMCSLVNAKSGGCAEDCGFCAQSRFAEAETPLHAMMEPEQILEHARAAEAAGAHRFCMVTQGQGLSKRDFEKVLEGARLVAEHTNLKRCASIGHMSVDARQGAQGGRHPARAPQRRDGRVLLPRGLHDGPLRGPAAHDRRGPRGRPGDLRRRHPQPRRVARAARRDGLRAGRDRPDVACRSTCSTRARARSSATATTWTRGRRSSGSRSSA